MDSLIQLPKCFFNRFFTLFSVIYSVTPDSGPSQITIGMDLTSNNAIGTRIWRMKIYQYECTSPVRAPSGCLQYYTQASGQFKSFNYKPDVIGDGPNHLANLNYAICFRIENGFCGIKYSQVTSDVNSFTISGDASNIVNLADTNRVKYSDTNCIKDYVVVPGATTGQDLLIENSKDRFCGTTLGACGSKQPGQACTETIGPITSKIIFKGIQI